MAISTVMHHARLRHVGDLEAVGSYSALIIHFFAVEKERLVPRAGGTAGARYGNPQMLAMTRI